MPTLVRAAAPIPLPIEACWEKLRDLSRASLYVPGVVAVRLTSERREGVGASRVVTHERFGEMDETVIAWREGRGFTLRLHKGDAPPRPFREASFRYALVPAGEDTEIHTEMTYTLPLGFLGEGLARILRPLFRRNVRDVAVCLARHYLTDAKVEDSELPALRATAL